MGNLTFLFFSIGILSPSSYATALSEFAEQKPLSKFEAEEIVNTRMEASKAAEIARREAIESKSAYAEWESVKRDGTKTIFRRVAPPPTPLKSPDSAPVWRQWTQEEIAEFLRREAEAKPRLNISLSATVFDHEVTEMTLWHEGSDIRS